MGELFQRDPDLNFSTVSKKTKLKLGFSRKKLYPLLRIPFLIVAPPQFQSILLWPPWNFLLFFCINPSGNPLFPLKSPHHPWNSSYFHSNRLEIFIDILNRGVSNFFWKNLISRRVVEWKKRNHIISQWYLLKNKYNGTISMRKIIFKFLGISTAFHKKYQDRRPPCMVSKWNGL